MKMIGVALESDLNVHGTASMCKKAIIEFNVERTVDSAQKLWAISLHETINKVKISIFSRGSLLGC